MNDDLQSYIEPELEARIVALVLGEASAFEAEELTRLIEERPELRTYRERMQKTHAFVGEAFEEKDDTDWKLSGERWQKVSSKIEEQIQEQKAFRARQREKRIARQKLVYACAACLVIAMVILVLGTATYSAGSIGKSSASYKSDEVEMTGGSSYVVQHNFEEMAYDAVKEETATMAYATVNKELPLEVKRQSVTQALASLDDAIPNGKGDIDQMVADGVALFDWKVSSEESSDRLYLKRGKDQNSEGAWDRFVSGNEGGKRRTVTSSNGRDFSNFDVDGFAEMEEFAESSFPVTPATPGAAGGRFESPSLPPKVQDSNESLGYRWAARESEQVNRPTAANLGDALGSSKEEVDLGWDFEFGNGKQDSKDFGIAGIVTGGNRSTRSREAKKQSKGKYAFSVDAAEPESGVSNVGEALSLSETRSKRLRASSTSPQSRDMEDDDEAEIVSSGLNQDFIGDGESIIPGIPRKPSAPSSTLKRVGYANIALPATVPVPDAVTPDPSVDLVDGGDFGGSNVGEALSLSETREALSKRLRASSTSRASQESFGRLDTKKSEPGGPAGELPLTYTAGINLGFDDNEAAKNTVGNSANQKNLSAYLSTDSEAPKSKGRNQTGTLSLYGEEIASIQDGDPFEDSGEGADPFGSAESENLTAEASSTRKKLDEIILPELDLENTTLEEALAFIQLRSVELDSNNLTSDGLGLELSARKPRTVPVEGDEIEGFGASADPNATVIKKLQLKDVPARVALDYIAAASHLRYKIEDDGKVTLLPLGDGEEDDIVQRRWVVPDGFGTFLSANSGPTNEDDPFAGDDDESEGIKARRTITDLLKFNGVSFPQNADATFLPESNTLIIRNSPTNLRLIDYIVDEHKKQTDQKKVDEEKARQEAEARKKLRENFETSTAAKSDSTFSLNVSDVSFKLAKAALAEGSWPEASKVRAEEFVNALDYDDAKPSQEEKVACVIEQGTHPFMQQRNLMRIAMSTASLGRNASTPLRLTILLDQSGSMERADRVESVQRAFALLSAQLKANDEISLIGFARTPRLLAERLKGDQSAQLAKIIANPLSEGGTNLEAALSSGLEIAKQQFVEGAQNRIILLTDGAANLGDALPENLARQVATMRQHDIAFDACGVGADGLNDEILSSLAKQGDGRYYFLDRPEDADEGFAKQIAGALRPAAKNVKVQILFNPERVSKFKLYGFEKHKLKKEDFRNDAVDAAEMAAEESGVALYHFETLPEGRGDIGTVSVRFLDTASKRMVERTWAISYEEEVALFSEAKPTLRLASVAGLFAEKLKGSPVGERVDLKRLRQQTELLKPAFESQPRFGELKTMLEQAGQ